MDRLLFTSMTGASEIIQAQTVIANNLSNVNTTGFKSDFAVLQAHQIEGEGYPSRVLVNSEDKGSHLLSGTITNTGNPLDLAINGRGWLVVEDPTGQEAYTRRGDLAVDPNGILRTGDGHPVMGGSGVISIPSGTESSIDQEGNIYTSVKKEGETKQVLLDRLKFVDPPSSALIKGTSGLFHSNTGLPFDEASNVKVVTHALEGSNVKGINEMVNMIDLARQFEVHLKMMETAKENDAEAAKVMS